MTPERSFPHVASINPVPPERYHDWGGSAEGQGALARVLAEGARNSAPPARAPGFLGWRRAKPWSGGGDAAAGRSLWGERHQAWSATAVWVAVAYAVLAVVGLAWLARDLPGSIAPAPLVTEPSAFGEVPGSPAPEVQGYLDALEARLRSKGIPVVSVSTQSPDAGTTDMIRRNSKSTDPLPLVCVRVAGLSALDGPDGYSLVLRDIERQAAIIGSRGIPIRYVVIVSVEADGSEKMESGGLVADLIPNAEWLTPPRQALDTTRQAVEACVQQKAASAGIDLTSVSVVEDDFGRTVTVEASAALEDVTKGKQFAESLDVSTRALNDTSGSKIVTLVVKVDTAGGSPLVRVVKDYALANGMSTSWTVR